MLSVENKPFVLNVVMLTVVMLTVFMLSVVMLSVVEPVKVTNTLAYCNRVELSTVESFILRPV
jgi:hypothetical protein